MTLNDREKFIMHMVTVMTLASLGDQIDIQLLQKQIRKGRTRKLTDKEVDVLWEDMKEEILNGRAVYEEMISSLGKDNDVFKKFDDGR
jgi:transposase